MLTSSATLASPRSPRNPTVQPPTRGLIRRFHRWQESKDGSRCHALPSLSPSFWILPTVGLGLRLEVPSLGPTHLVLALENCPTRLYPHCPPSGVGQEGLSDPQPRGSGSRCPGSLDSTGYGGHGWLSPLASWLLWETGADIGGQARAPGTGTESPGWEPCGSRSEARYLQHCPTLPPCSGL